jgi:hypothetical protein
MLVAFAYQAGAQTPAVVATGSLTGARYHHAAVVLPNGKVLAAGGHGSSQIATAELYNPTTGTWATTGSMTSARFVHTATLLTNGLVLVAGGFDGGSYLASAELYDSTNGTWAATGAMNSPRYNHTATLLPNGKVLVAGGNNGGTWLTSTELYDPVSGTWSTNGPLTTARVEATAVLLTNGLVLIAGGRDVGGNSLASAELYNPATGTWSASGSMSAVRESHAMTVLADGRVLVAGGVGNLAGQTHLSSAEIYNPATGTWTVTGSLGTARQYHRLTRLPSGKVLAVGGNNGPALTSTELFNPTSGTWSTSSSLQAGRYHFTATTLADGRTLLTGGQQASGGAALSSAELIVEAPAGLVAYYPGNGNAQDAAGGNHGTLVNGTAFTTGVIGQAFSFDGVDDQVEIPHTAANSPSNAVTVSAWIRPLAYEDNKHCVSKGSHVNYFSRSYSLQGPWADGKWRATLSVPGGEVVVASAANAVLAGWSHVLMTYDGTSVKLYVNGELAGSQSTNGLITQTSEPLFLGSHKFYAASDYWFNGAVDEVQIYNRALSAAEVAQLYSTTPASSAPVITAQPTGATVNVGDSASFNATAAGSLPLSFQWLKDGTNLPGATNPTLSLSTLQTNQAGSYRLVITNVAGSITSSVVTLTVNRLAQTITFGTLAGKRVDDVPFTVSATSSSGLPVSYSSSDTAVATVSGNAVTIAGIGSTTITASQAGDATYLAAASVTRTLAVAGIPPGISSQPTGLVINVTSNAAFSVTGTGTAPLTYQWRKEGTDIGGATGATLGLPNVQTNQAGNYSVVIANAWGSITSSVVTLTVNRLAQTITFGALAGKRVDDVPFTVSATSSSGLPVSFSSSDAAVAAVGGTTVTITGVGNATITASQAGDSIYLPATSVGRTLVVAGIPPGISSQPTGVTVNVTGTAAFGVTAAGTAPLSYQWRKDGVNIGGATGASLGLVNVQTNQAGSYAVVITNAWGSITSSVVTLTVNRLAQTITFGALPGKRVDDNPFSMAATANSGLPVSYSSSATSVATVSGSTVTIIGVGSTTITASQAGDATYLPATSVSQTLVVSAAPSIGTQPVGQAFTLGSAVTLSVGAGGTGPLSYQWQFNGVNISGATGATLALTNLSATNAGAYRVVITNAVGTVTSIPVDLHFFGDLKFIAATVLAGSIGQQYRVDYADVVTVGTTNWLTLTNVTLPYSPFLVVDPNSAGRTQRYYRAVPVP